MSGLNISDATNSVKAAAQQTASKAGEESQMAQHPVTQTQEPDVDKSQQATLLQAPGPLHDPEIAEIIGPVCEPAAVKKEPVSIKVEEKSNKAANREACAILMTKVLQAERAGDDTKVKRYMKMFKAVLADRKPAPQKTALRCVGPTITQSPVIPQKRPATPSEMTQVRNVKFITGEWQEKALAKHSKNQPKIEESALEKGLRYHSFPFPLPGPCRMDPSSQGALLPSPPETRLHGSPEETADEAISTCRDFNKIGLQDNPYAMGDGKVRGDPMKGIQPSKSNRCNPPAHPNPPKTKSNQKGTMDESSSTMQGHSSLPPKPNQGRVPPGSGYKGNNFNPNHTGGSMQNPTTTTPHTIVPTPSPFFPTSHHAMDTDRLPEQRATPEPERNNLGLPKWPTRVTCEMDIDGWEKALSQAGLAEKYSDFICGFKKGFHQGIPEHNLGPGIPYYTPPNHQGSMLAREKIEATIAKEIVAGRMFGPFSHKQLMEQYGFFQTFPRRGAKLAFHLSLPIMDVCKASKSLDVVKVWLVAVP
ncbi:hypothetical protein PTTG_26016 [Puccinia triticina 1-1 BBBD Race 1]|uniref:Uncharacterized protein n=1 Tax=Puccinia triticina (isolate 1-1 / race 1 (BBBD)) TaxID=630390 RepID=A0A180GZ38_PUCT1|nr:hypothetical protein PTTG_26016 [Puccinia triticina 1-1 BBBD Race 1]